MSAGMQEMAGVRAEVGASIKAQGKAKIEDYVFAVFDILTLALDAGPAHKTKVSYFSNQGAQGAWKGWGAPRSSESASSKPNPWFLANGHEDGGSPVTQKYLFTRSWKSAGGTMVSAIGGAVKYGGSVINVGSALRHGSAAATSLMHLQQIAAIARSHRNSETIARWCETIIKAKAAKATNRTIQTVGAVVPVPLVGTIANTIAAAGKLGLKIGLPEMCYLAAAEIHWRAFREQRIANFGAPSAVIVFGAPTGKAAMRTAGPASRIFNTMMTRRGITAAMGQYDVGAMINEPAGWLALGDKLSRD